MMFYELNVIIGQGFSSEDVVTIFKPCRDSSYSVAPIWESFRAPPLSTSSLQWFESFGLVCCQNDSLSENEQLSVELEQLAVSGVYRFVADDTGLSFVKTQTMETKAEGKFILQNGTEEARVLGLAQGITTNGIHHFQVTAVGLLEPKEEKAFETETVLYVKKGEAETGTMGNVEFGATKVEFTKERTKITIRYEETSGAFVIVD